VTVASLDGLKLGPEDVISHHPLRRPRAFSSARSTLLVADTPTSSPMMKKMLGFLSADCGVAIRNAFALGEGSRPVECTKHIAKKSHLLKAADVRRRQFSCRGLILQLDFRAILPQRNYRNGTFRIAPVQMHGDSLGR
jgi:hypothetical protein